jgi:hypothetical protein
MNGKLIGILVMALGLVTAGCGMGPISADRRTGNYLVVADLADVGIASVGYSNAAPTVRRIANSDWGIDAVAGRSVAAVIDERVDGKGIAVDDAELTGRLSYEKILLLRKLDDDDAAFIRERYAAQAPRYLVLLTKARVGMSELYGTGVRQKNIPMADYRCQFYAAMQLDLIDLGTGRILSTLTESKTDNCAIDKYFDDINNISDDAPALIREGVVRLTGKTANRIARHLLMTDAEKDEFRFRVPGFE